MNKIKKTILSALLFTFTFLIVHDYVMADIDKSAYQVNSVDKECQISKQTAEKLCAVSHLHDSIHIMIAMDTDTTLHSSLVVDNRLSYTKFGFSSYNKFVLERPPLS